MTFRCCLVGFFILIAVIVCIAISVIATQIQKAELTIQGNLPCNTKGGIRVIEGTAYIQISRFRLHTCTDCIRFDRSLEQAGAPFLDVVCFCCRACTLPPFWCHSFRCTKKCLWSSCTLTIAWASPLLQRSNIKPKHSTACYNGSAPRMTREICMLSDLGTFSTILRQRDSW